jgi:tripartite-type tricarboxylate transporter receptor subunit TctC
MAPSFSRVARAQAYPARPITMIAPFAAGGPTDVIGRVVAERMRRSLGQPVVIENVTGAEGSIGTGRVARAKVDGYIGNHKDIRKQDRGVEPEPSDRLQRYLGSQIARMR